MQTRAPNQMNWLAEMTGAGTASGKRSELPHGQRRGEGAAAGPGWPRRPGTEHQQRTSCRMRFCTGTGLQRPPARWAREPALRSSYSKTLRSAMGWREGQWAMRLFPTHNLSLFASESNFPIVAPETEPMTASFLFSSERTTTAGHGRDCRHPTTPPCTCSSLKTCPHPNIRAAPTSTRSNHHHLLP